jgi:drug/metabolite transporter (DMT)-like permease
VALTQLAFVIGSVYLKSNLKYVDEESGETFHPIVYAFIREAVAGPILYLLAWLHTGALLRQPGRAGRRLAAGPCAAGPLALDPPPPTATATAAAGTVWPSWHDAGRVVALGVCMFTSQLFYIMGIELSGVTIATCIQPAIPVFTALLGVALQMESAHPQKLLGIAMAVAGSICMVSRGEPSRRAGYLRLLTAPTRRSVRAEPVRCARPCAGRRWRVWPRARPPVDQGCRKPAGRQPVPAGQHLCHGLLLHPGKAGRAEVPSNRRLSMGVHHR